jgi:hypothetical protein
VNRAAAFVLLKRFKEVVWIAVGWILLLASRRRADEPTQPPRPPSRHAQGAPF